jgi:hypothetical protein
MAKTSWVGMLILIALQGFLCAIPYGGGTGTADDPYQIYTAEQMNTIGLNPSDWSKCFKLMTDIDLSVYTGTQFNCIGTSRDQVFAGVFDGNGHRIMNLKIEPTGTASYVGLFAHLGGSSRIQNLGLEDVVIIGGNQSFGLGTLCAAHWSGTISNCFATGTISAGNQSSYLGGLCASASWNAEIVNCYSNVRITGGDDSQYIGGLSGQYYGKIINSYAIGRITAGNRSSPLGGLSGWTPGTITNSFWDTLTTGMATSSGGTGKTTAEMKDINTYLSAGWDFAGEVNNGTEDIWTMPTGGLNDGYPYLSWRNFSPVVKVCDDIQIVFPEKSAHLSADVTDDGKPYGILSTVWSVQSGHGIVSFDPNEFVLDPVVTLSLPGTYVLRLTANDGDRGKYDELTITYVYSVMYVDVNAKGLQNGSSWTDAFVSIQDALLLAFPGTEIRVAQGTYRPDQSIGITPGDRMASFQLKKGIVLNGGFAGVGAPNPDERDILAYPTILSGDLAGNDIVVTDIKKLQSEPSRSENSYHVVTAISVDNTSILDGLTITSGNANGPADQQLYRGGGIFIDNASPTITNCNFTACTATVGGAVCTYTKTNATFLACHFNANAASYGGAAIAYSVCSLDGCSLTGNYAIYGGGFYSGSGGRAIRTLITQNTATRDGGGVYNSSSTTTLTNCTLADNTATRAGAGLYTTAAAKPTIVNSILWNNKVGSLTDKSAQLTGGQFTIYYSTIQGWYGDDPLFADPTVGDYHLKSKAGRYDPATDTWITDKITSPAIDAGSPFDLVADEPAPNGGRINQGFDGGTFFASKSIPQITSDLNRDGIVNMLDLAIVSTHWLEGI